MDEEKKRNISIGAIFIFVIIIFPLMSRSENEVVKGIFYSLGGLLVFYGILIGTNLFIEKKRVNLFYLIFGYFAITGVLSGLLYIILAGFKIQEPNIYLLIFFTSLLLFSTRELKHNATIQTIGKKSYRANSREISKMTKEIIISLFLAGIIGFIIFESGLGSFFGNEMLDKVMLISFITSIILTTLDKITIK